MQFDICCYWTWTEKANLGLEDVQVEKIVGEFTENVFVELNLAMELCVTISENHVVFKIIKKFCFSLESLKSPINQAKE